MKVGDVVRFSKEHTSRPGYVYCADWTGIILESVPRRVTIFWTCPSNGHFTAYYESHIEAYQRLEVVSEGR
jgi:hypothetical protein